jgi:hypothetical protein
MKKRWSEYSFATTGSSTACAGMKKRGSSLIPALFGTSRIAHWEKGRSKPRCEVGEESTWAAPTPMDETGTGRAVGVCHGKPQQGMARHALPDTHGGQFHSREEPVRSAPLPRFEVAKER